MLCGSLRWLHLGQTHALPQQAGLLRVTDALIATFFGVFSLSSPPGTRHASKYQNNLNEYSKNISSSSSSSSSSTLLYLVNNWFTAVRT